MFLIEFGVQRSSTLDIELEVWFLGSRVLCFPLKNTVSHIYTTKKRKVQRSSPLDLGSRNMVSGLKSDTISHIWTTHGMYGTQDFIMPFLYSLRKEVIYTY
jgi:hypothetical protein